MGVGSSELRGGQTTRAVLSRHFEQPALHFMHRLQLFLSWYGMASHGKKYVFPTAKKTKVKLTQQVPKCSFSSSHF